MRIQSIQGCAVCGDSTSNGRLCPNCKSKVDRKTKEVKKQKADFLSLLEKELRLRQA